MTERDPFSFFKSAPDYHSMGILNIYYPLAKGWTLDLARSPDRVLTDLRHFETQGFLAVPLILDKVYGNVRREIDAGGIKGRLIARAVRAKQNLARGKASLTDRFVHTTVGKKIVGQIRRKLADRVGKRLELLIVGAAKADPDALNFFQEVLDIKAYEGYGATECCPLIAINHRRGQKTGTVGRPLIEVKLVDGRGWEVGCGNPATGAYRGSGGVAGELWVSGAHVMKEYLDDPEQTAKVLVRDPEGKVWYRTGDLFSLDDEGYLTFRGRVGRQFKLKNGEFVNPERLERLYAGLPLVEHVLIYGDQTRSFPLPLVTVQLEEAERQADIPNLPVDDPQALRVHPAIAGRIREQMLREATRAGLPGHERPQKILLVPESFSEAAGTLTAGLKKLIPKAILSRYAELIDQTYRE
jgi:long-chain acyl-CoA synthetase